MFHLHKTSQLVTVSPSFTLADYERLLNEDGFTGGYYPLSGYQSSLDQCLKARTPNLFFLKYGGIEDLCAGGLALTHKGTPFPIKAVPRAATGPDLRKIIIGSQGKTARFKEVTLRIFPLPEIECWGLALAASETLSRQVLWDMLGVMIRPLFAKILEDEESLGLLRSLNLDEEDHSVLAFKLAGQKSMVRAEKEALSRMNDGKKIFFYWPEKKAEAEILEKTLVHPEAYLQFAKKEPLWSGKEAKMTEAEEEFIKFFGTY